jgi:hypothetical protein
MKKIIKRSPTSRVIAVIWKPKEAASGWLLAAG